MALTQIKSSNIADGTVAAADIADDSIINADIKSDAAIDASKLGSIPASKLASALDLSGKTVTLPAVSVTAHALPAEIGFSNVSTWADSAVETVTLSPVATGIGKAQVAVYEEIPDVNKTNATWDITANDTGFNLVDSAYAQTLTPAATTGDSIAFTLGGGSWVTADIGKRIVNVSTSETGEARIISIASTVATCIITTAFTDTNAIASGDWELYAGEFDADGNFALSNSTQAGGISVSAFEEFSDNESSYVNVTVLTSTKALIVYQYNPSGQKVRAVVVDRVAGRLVVGTPVVVESGGTGSNIDVQRLTDTTALVCYKYGSAGKTKILSVSGTTITLGTTAEFASNIDRTSVSILSSTQGIVSYRHGSSPYNPYVALLNVSGTTVSPVSSQLVSSIYNGVDPAVAALSATKAIVVYFNAGTGKPTGHLLSIAGSNTTVGPTVVLDATTVTQGDHKIEAISSTQALVSWTAGDIIYAQVVSVSGSTIVGGSFTDITTSNESDPHNGQVSMTVISSTRAVVLSAIAGQQGVLIDLTISGTTITVAGTVRIGYFNQNYHGMDSFTIDKLFLAAGVSNYQGLTRLVDLDAIYTQSADPTVFEAASTQYPDVTSLDATTGVIVYTDAGNSNYATAVHYTTNLTTRITTYGTPLVFLSSASDTVRVDRLSATKVITVCSFNNDVFANVLTVSGTTLTSGTQLTMLGDEKQDVCALSETQALAVYEKGSSTYCVVLNISGTTITKGSDVVYESGQIGSHSNKVSKLSSTKAIVGYVDDDNSDYYTACVIDVSGSTATPGTPQVIDSGASASHGYNSMAAISSTKAICSYFMSSNPYLRILTISGTTITIGAAVDYLPAADSGPRSIAVLSESEAFLAYQSGVDGTGRYQLIDISTTTPVLGTEKIFLAGNTAVLIEASTLYGSTSDAIVVFRHNQTDHGNSIILSKLSAPLYASSQYVTTISGTDSVDTTYYSDWNSNTITETLGGQSAYYAFSVNSTPSAAEVTGGTFLVVGSGQTATRNIVSSLSAVHGGTAGVWYKNTNATYGSETWAAATTNEAKAAIQEATATTANQMSGTAFAAISDANLPAFGTQMSVAMTLYSADNTVSPTIDGVSFNYDGNVINRLETDAYTVEMPTTAAIRVTAPSSGGPRNARVYVSS